jgi:hypothetical protein
MCGEVLETIGKIIGWIYLIISTFVIIAASVIYITLIFMEPLGNQKFLLPEFYSGIQNLSKEIFFRWR